MFSSIIVVHMGLTIQGTIPSPAFFFFLVGVRWEKTKRYPPGIFYLCHTNGTFESMIFTVSPGGIC